MSASTKPPTNPAGQPTQATPMTAGDEALQKAIQSYVKKLSDDEKAAFRSAPDIIDHLHDMQSKRKSLISSSHISRVEKVLQCVKGFMGSLSICIQHNPEISSLVVGGVNCILTLVLGYIEFFERLTGMMESIGTHLSYLLQYSKPPFQESDKLQETLIAAYCDLLDFYVKARQVFINKEGKASYVQGFKLFFRLAWEPFEAQFSSIEACFSNHAIAVVRLATVDFQVRVLGHQNQQDELRRQAEDKRNKEEASKNEMHRLEEDRKNKEVATDMRRIILRWLSSDEFEETHDIHFKKRFENTGQWLLDHPRFGCWKDEAQSSLLWCYGAPGSGKTILASLVIEHLSACYQLSADTGMAFIYCSYKESRTTVAYMRAVLKQLCRSMQSVPPKLEALYERHYRNDSQPKYDELRIVLLAIIQQYGRIFLVLDALDECSQDQRKDLCDFIFSITNTTTSTSTSGIVKLFVTSRKEPGIERAFRQKAIPMIEVEAERVDSDIKVYVKAEIELRLQDGRLILRNMALKDKILSALTKKAGGMFLWVTFQLDAICAEVSDRGIERALRRVPEDMDATYKRILGTINAKPQAQRELARRVLMWIAYTRKPLSIDDLAYVVSIDTDMTSLEDLESSLPTEESIVGACANLISVDRPRSDGSLLTLFPGRGLYVRFVHFSVQEFLTSHRPTASYMGYEVAHREITRACMIFLTLLPEQSKFKTRIQQYAFDEWPHHLLAGNLNSLPVDGQTAALTLSFLQNSPLLLTKQPTKLYSIWKHKTYLKFSPPVLELIFDLQDIKRQFGHWQEKYQLRVVHDGDSNDIVLSDDKLAVHYAAAELDSIPVVRRLHKQGQTLNHSHSDPDAVSRVRVQDWLQLPPLYSVQSTNMVKYLLDNDICIKPQSLYYRDADPLQYFAKKGDWGVKVFELLLDRMLKNSPWTSDSPWAAAQDHRRLLDALQAAVEVDCSEVVRLLLDKGVDSSTLLQDAVSGGKIEVARLLLDRGGDLDPQNSALLAAVYQENVEVIQLLLDKGANVNARSREDALEAAVQKGSVEVVQLLLDKGADVKPRDRSRSVLEAAVMQLHRDRNGLGPFLSQFSRGRVEVIRLLLDKGANDNTQGGTNADALQAAVCSGNVEAIQLLLDKGADVNSWSLGYVYLLPNAFIGHSYSALQSAVINGNVEVIQLLLDKGADVNAHGGGAYSNALQAAVEKGDVEVIQLLLDNGADVNAQDIQDPSKRYWSNTSSSNALQAAVIKDNVEVIQLLLDKGADVNVQSTKFDDTALAAAANNGNIEVIQLLLAKGADVNAQGGRYGNALQAAVFNGNVKVIQLLLDKGADVNAQGGLYANALQAAVQKGDVEVIQLLLDKGADVNAHQLSGPGSAAIWYELGYSCNALQDAVLKNDNIKVTQLLLDRGANSNAQGGHFGNTLRAAVFRGNVEVIRLLIDKGADIHARGRGYDDSWQAAVVEGNIEIIQLLLDKGADVNSQGGKYGSALRAAIYKDNVKFVQLLLDKGASVHAQGGRYGNALRAAVLKGNIEIIQLLLDKGADVNAQGERYGNALGAAVYKGNAEVIQLLLDKGANVNAQSGRYGNPLRAALYNVKVVQLQPHKGAEIIARTRRIYGNGRRAARNAARKAAAIKGTIKVIQLLLDNGADVNAHGGKFGNALRAAVDNGNIEVIQLLLDKGADVNAHGGRFGNALRAAVSNGNVEVIQLLLKKGADVNAQGGNALRTAVDMGNVEVIQLLLENGADINAQGGRYGNALRAAVYNGNVEVIQLLLDKGANVNAQGRRYGNALGAALYKGKVEVIQLLLDKGANINTQSGRYGNLLRAAVYNGNVEVIQLLLGKGADVNAQGGNALRAAVYMGNVEVIQLLLDNGADINAQGGRYGNSLQAAAYKGKMEHIRLLLDQGADVNSQGGMFGTVLQAAAYNGNIEVIRLLLDKGAIVDYRGGTYGAALEKMLALQPPGPGLQVPGDAPLLVKLIQDHAPFLIRHLPESEHEGIASWYLRNGDRCRLDVFAELLESYRCKREPGRDKEEEPSKLKTEREL